MDILSFNPSLQLAHVHFFFRLGEFFFDFAARTPNDGTVHQFKECPSSQDFSQLVVGYADNIELTRRTVQYQIRYMHRI